MSEQFDIPAPRPPSMRGKRYYNPKQGEVARLPDQLLLTRGQPGIMAAPHWHPQVELNYVVRGTIDYEMQDYAVHIAEGEMALFWGGLPHRVIDTAEDTLFTVIHLPLYQFFRLHLAPETQHRVMHGAILLTTEAHPDDDGAVLRWCDYVASGDSRRFRHAIEEMLLRIERLEMEPHRMVDRDTSARAASNATLARRFAAVSRMSGYIGANFRDEIDSADIAVAADMHPKYAMSVFKSVTGLSLGEYLSLLRLSYAQALLVSDDRSILDIAMASGFGSVSAFNKSFRKVAGMTPRDFRRQNTEGAATGPRETRARR